MLFIAKRSFLDILAALVIALLFLMPNILLHTIGWGLVWLSTVRTIWHVNHWRKYRAAAARAFHLMEYLASVGLTLLLTSAGATTLASSPIAPQLIYAGAIGLLFGSCQSAWRLLVR
jgi:hypothetical protein